VLVFAGELLKRAEDLLRMGMHPSEIVEGYEKAFDKMMHYLETDVLTIGHVTAVGASAVGLTNVLMGPVQSALATKQYGYETFLSKLVIQAALQVLPWKNPKAFNVDSVRVVKIMGGSILDSQVIPGMVFGRQPER
jgi:T-complex protein 1 subunit theta